jgi:signal transduction histidine kinase
MLILVVSIILFVVYYQKRVLSQKNDFQKQLLSATVQVEENERERIAKNLHDDLGILLTGLRQDLNKAARNAGDRQLLEEIHKHSNQLLDESLKTVRETVKDLTPKNLSKYGYLGVLRELCAQLNKAGHVTVELHEDSVPEFSQKKALQLYRLSKELLNNILKHAQPAHITIAFEAGADNCHMRITHNGAGISNEAVRQLSREGKGLGLKSIESRAQLINAGVYYHAGASTEKPYVEVIIAYEHQETN